MKFSILQRLLLSSFSGLLLALSFPHIGSLFFLSFIAWIPLLLVESDISQQKQNSFKVFAYSTLTLLIYNTIVIYWVFYTVGGEGRAILAFFASAFLMSIFFFIFHLTKRLTPNKTIGNLSFIIWWMVFEYNHYYWEMSYPWLNIGNIFAIRPEIIQWYSVTGTLGGTLWILLVNYFLFLVIKNILFNKQTLKTQRINLLIGLGLIIIPSVSSYIYYLNYKEVENPMEVVITQPNIDTYTMKFKTDKEGLIEQLDLCLNQADSLITENTKVVLTPETLISIPLHLDGYKDNVHFMHLQEWVNRQEYDISLVTGAGTFKFFDKRIRPSMKPVEGQNYFFELYDDLILINKDTPPRFVHKSELVLGTEKIPLIKWFPSLENFAYDTGELMGTLGVEEEPRIVHDRNYTFAPVICYESVYGWRSATQTSQRAEVIYIITNDGWWGDSPGHKQHNSWARLRAIETRRYVARSANTGISSIINQRGDIVMATRYDKYEGLRGDVQLNKEVTFYAQHGDYIGKIAIYLLYILIVYIVITKFVAFTKGTPTKKTKK